MILDKEPLSDSTVAFAHAQYCKKLELYQMHLHIYSLSEPVRHDISLSQFHWWAAQGQVTRSWLSWLGPY